MQAKKSLGQNFLKNDTIVKKIVSLFVCNENDLIIEIGPGRGALTKHLNSLTNNWLAIEVDKDMEAYLNQYGSHIIYEDILNIDFPSLLKKHNYNNLYIIGNLPYYITSPIIEKIINSNINVNKMIFMVQKEVAERFTSKPGCREYGYMTVFINHFYDVKYEFMVPRTEFNPSPKVDSAIITLNYKEHDIPSNEYWQFIKDCFAHKRKTLKNNLIKYDSLIVDNVLKKYGLNSTARAEDLSEEVFKELYEECKEK